MPKDACYSKVKAQYAVFPSARASQAIGTGEKDLQQHKSNLRFSIGGHTRRVAQCFHINRIHTTRS